MATYVYGDSDELAQAAADAVTRHLVELARGGECAFVLTGGTTPRRLYDALARRQTGAAAWIPWRAIHLFWGDERAVPPDHPQSNYRLAHEHLLGAVPVADERVHRIEGELGAQAAAERYEAELREYFRAGRERFDLVLLGMGADGHIASLFPEDGTIETASRMVIPTPAHDGLERVSLTFPVLVDARHVLMLVEGSHKAAALSRALRKDSTLPAGRLQHQRPDLVWFVDTAAARAL